MNIKRVHLYYFSGTGNTLLVCRKMKEVFESKGVETRLFAIEKETPQNIDLTTTIGLAFPIAVFTTYPLVMKFIKNMPETDGTKVFMVDTMGGLSIGIKSVIKSILKKKGYTPIAAAQIVMPSNFLPSAEKEPQNPKIRKKGLDATERYATSILDGTATWGVFPVLPHVFYPISQFVFNIPSFRKKSVKFDREKCIKCGLCSRLCPVENIVMHEYPTFVGKCEACARCFSFCPSGALYYKKLGSHVYRAVKPEELL